MGCSGACTSRRVYAIELSDQRITAFSSRNGPAFASPPRLNQTIFAVGATGDSIWCLPSTAITILYDPIDGCCHSSANPALRGHAQSRLIYSIPFLHRSAFLLHNALNRCLPETAYRLLFRPRRANQSFPRSRCPCCPFLLNADFHFSNRLHSAAPEQALPVELPALL